LRTATRLKRLPLPVRGAVCALRGLRGFECTDNHSSAINALPAGAAVVYTPPRCEAGQTEGSGGRGAGGGRLVKSPPCCRFLSPVSFGHTKEIGPSETLAAAFRDALPESPSHFAEQNASPLSKGAFCGLHRTEKRLPLLVRGAVGLKAD